MNAIDAYIVWTGNFDHNADNPTRGKLLVVSKEQVSQWHGSTGDFELWDGVIRLGDVMSEMPTKSKPEIVRRLFVRFVDLTVDHKIEPSIVEREFLKIREFNEAMNGGLTQ